MGWFVRLCWLWRWVLIHGALLCCRDPSWIPFPPPFRRPLTRHPSKRPGLSWLLPRTVGHWSSLRSRVSCRRKCLDQPVYCAVLKLYSNLILSLCECDTATRSYVEWSCPCYYLSWTCVCFCFIPLSDIWFLKSSVSCMHHLALVLLVVITWRNTQSLQQNSIGGSWGVTIRLCCSCVECYDVTSHSPWVKLRSDIIPSSLWIFLHPIQKYSIGWILKQAT